MTISLLIVILHLQRYAENVIRCRLYTLMFNILVVAITSMHKFGTIGGKIGKIP